MAALEYVQGENCLEGSAPFRFWLSRNSVGMDLLEKAKCGAKAREGEVELHQNAAQLVKELNEELLPALKPNALTRAELDRLSEWVARAANVTNDKKPSLGPARQALQLAMGATMHDKLKDVVDSALRGIVCHAVTEATHALRNNG